MCKRSVSRQAIGKNALEQDDGCRRRSRQREMRQCAGLLGDACTRCWSRSPDGGGGEWADECGIIGDSGLWVEILHL